MRDMGGLIRLDKIKVPGGRCSFELTYLVEDDYGVWLYGRPGARWEMPDRSGHLDHAVMSLIQPGQAFLSWWIDDPDDRHLSIDVCLPPEETELGWRYVDLELDPVRHSDGLVEIEDVDEFDAAYRAGWISIEHAQLAQQTSLVMARRLEAGVEPWGQFGWQRLGELLERSDN